jgi:hypothetical protein
MSNVEANELTWETLARLEPRLADLLEQVQNTELEEGERAHDFFYDMVKPRIERLVGWDRKSGPAILQTEDAYSVAIATFWAAPPYDYDEDADRVMEVLVDYFGGDGASATEWKTACAEEGISQTRYYRGRKQLVRLGRVDQTAPGERENLFMPCD